MVGTYGDSGDLSPPIFYIYFNPIPIGKRVRLFPLHRPVPTGFENLPLGLTSRHSIRVHVEHKTRFIKSKFNIS